MDTEEKARLYDLLILGGGPAGLSAAMYAGRAGLSTLIIERGAIGGAIFRAAKIENYPGGLKGESGAEFAARLEAQADAFGAEKAAGAATSARLSGKVKEISVGDTVYRGRSLIIAAGIVPAKLGVPGEAEYVGRGVSYCAVCDGPFFTGLDVFVVGGGDIAIEEGMDLAKLSRKVTVIHQRSSFRAAKRLTARAEKTVNIGFMFDTVVTEVGGGDLLTRIEVKNVKTGEERSIVASEGENFGLFVSIEPAAELFDVEIDMKDGYIVTDEEMHTNIPGVFAAGDVRYKKLRQVVTAAADGAIAATEAKKFLMEEE
jgi:thioredoxin reductase (NADPH)